MNKQLLLASMIPALAWTTLVSTIIVLVSAPFLLLGIFAVAYVVVVIAGYLLMKRGDTGDDDDNSFVMP